jgi:hypothetical protein
MKKIRDTFIKAPQGFWGIDPDTKNRIDGCSYRVLKSKWIAHRVANDLKWQDVEQWMQDQICEREGGSYCVDSATGRHNPSIGEMFGNLIESTSVWILGGMKKTPMEEVSHRLEICKTCEFYDPNGFIGTGKCMKCGCSAAKIYMETALCPIGKW